MVENSVVFFNDVLYRCLLSEKVFTLYILKEGFDGVSGLFGCDVRRGREGSLQGFFLGRNVGGKDQVLVQREFVFYLGVSWRNIQFSKI